MTESQPLISDRATHVTATIFSIGTSFDIRFGKDYITCIKLIVTQSGDYSLILKVQTHDTR